MSTQTHAESDGCQIPVSGWSPAVAEAVARALGLAAYRGRQVMAWVFAHGRLQWKDMTNLSKELRRTLAGNLSVTASRLEKLLKDSDGTRKAILRLTSNELIESVLVPDGSRLTACLSTQVGCPMGCVFCASGLQGLSRNLTRAEVIDQLLFLRDAVDRDQPLTNVVFMGMGEPLANFGVLAEAIETMTSRWGFAMSGRRITVSTVGLVKGIANLQTLPQKVNLALSLHAPNESLRRTLVPTSAPGDFEDILQAVWEYQRVTRRRITFEYVLLKGVNDHPCHARDLAAIVRDRPCRINVIPYNAVGATAHKRPDPETVENFLAGLRRAGVRATMRTRKGAGIDAACGQLTWRDRGEVADAAPRTP